MSLFKLIAIVYLVMDACVCTPTLVHLCISEMNGSNNSRNRKEELEIFCYYKVLVLLVRQYSII